MRRQFIELVGGVGMAASLVVGCGSPSAECIDEEAFAACGDAPAPTYAELYAEVLGPSCGVPGVSCHGPGGRTSPLDLSDADAARLDLLERLVVPGAPACSELAQRVVSSDRFFRMPPTGTLSEADRCAIVRWIAAGAR